MVPSPETATNKVRVLVVDDHPVVRAGLRNLLNRQTDLACCAEAGSVPDALAAATREQPSLVLMDIRLKNGDGLELTKTLRVLFPEMRVLVLSQNDSILYAERALRAGAMGYVVKDQSAEDLLLAIRTVLAGNIYLNPQFAAQLLDKFIANGPKSTRENGIPLTDRELHVLQLLGDGMGTRAIAQELSLSFKTIESHRENIKRKLGLKGAHALVHFATEWAGNQGLGLDPDSGTRHSTPVSIG